MRLCTFKSSILLSFILLISLSSSFASHIAIDTYFGDEGQLGKLLYSAWHISGDEFTYNNQLLERIEKFKVRGFPDPVTANNIEVIINKKETYNIAAGKCTPGKIYRICIAQVDHVKDNDGDGLLDSEDNDDDNDGRLDINDKDTPNLLGNSRIISGTKYAGFNIRIYQLYPELEVTRSFSKSTIRAGETNTISLTVKNKGITNTKNFKLIEEVPKQYEIIHSPYDITQNNITFDDEVPAKSQETFSYTVKLKNWPLDSFSYTYFYDLGDEQFTKKEYASYPVEEPIKITQTFDPPNNINASNIVKYKLVLEGNDRDEVVNVKDLAFQIPKGLKIAEKSANILYKNGQDTWSGSLRYEFKQDFEYALIPQKNGEYNISVKATLSLRGFTFTKTFTKQITVGKKKVPTVQPQIEEPQKTTGDNKQDLQTTNITPTTSQESMQAKEPNQTNQSITYRPLPKEKPENLFIGIWRTLKEIFTTLFS